jgi:hypothetical protein
MSLWFFIDFITFINDCLTESNHQYKRYAREILITTIVINNKEKQFYLPYNTDMMGKYPI